MKIKDFTAFHLAPEHAVKLLSDRIDSFIKGDKSIVVISLSHAITEIQSNSEGERFMASAILCYK